MTENYHVPPTNADSNDISTIAVPLAALDAGITANAAELVVQDARIDLISVTAGSVNTTATGDVAGVTLGVADGSAIVDDSWLAIYTTGGTVEYRQVSSGGGTNTLTLTAAHSGTTSGGQVSMLPAGIYEASVAANYGGTVTSPTLADQINWVGAGRVNVMAYGATGDGATDDSTAIQAADDAVTNGGIVFFPPGKYLISSNVAKSVYTTWIGSGAGRSTAGYATTLYTTGNIAMVTVETTAGTLYGKYAGFENISFLKDAYNVAHTASFGLRFLGTSGSPRQQRIVNCDFRNFYYNIHISGAGELYFDRVFSTSALYSFYADGIADSMISRSLFGSGLTTGPTGQSAVQIQRSGNLLFNNVRFQTQKGGQGLRMTSCRDVSMVQCIVDQNESYGVYLINCENVQVSSSDVFDNGTTGTPVAGVRVTASGETFTADAGTDICTISGSYLLYTGQQVQVSSDTTLPAGLSASTNYYISRINATTFYLCTTYANAVAGTGVNITDAGTGTHTLLGLSKNIRILGGSIRDRNKGGASEVQQYGVQFTTGASTGLVSNVSITGVHFDVTDVLLTPGSVSSGLTVYAHPTKTGLVQEVGDAGLTMKQFSPEVVVYTAAITANRTVALPSVSATDDEERLLPRVRVIRSAAATGAFNVNVTNNSGTLRALSTPLDWADFAFSETTGDYVLVSNSAPRLFPLDNTTTSTSGTGEDDLKSTVIPADSMGTTGAIRVEAAGTKTGAAGNKTIKLYLGTTAITVFPAANDTSDWILEADIINTAAAVQRVVWKLYGPTGLVGSGYDTMTENTAAAATVKITGECADGGDAVTAERWRVQLLQ